MTVRGVELQVPESNPDCAVCSGVGEVILELVENLVRADLQIAELKVENQELKRKVASQRANSNQRPRSRRRGRR